MQDGSDTMLEAGKFPKNPASGRRDPKGSSKVKSDPSKTSIKNVKPIKSTRAGKVNSNLGPNKKGK